MPLFDAVEAKILRAAVSRFQQAIETELAEPVRSQLRGYRPPEVSELFEELMLVGQQPGSGEPPFDVHEIHARLLEAVITHQRRALAGEIDEPRRRTGHRETIRYLEKELRILDGVVHAQWFSEVTSARLPRLSDYLSLRFAERALGGAQPCGSSIAFKRRSAISDSRASIRHPRFRLASAPWDPGAF